MFSIRQQEIDEFAEEPFEDEAEAEEQAEVEEEYTSTPGGVPVDLSNLRYGFVEVVRSVHGFERQPAMKLSTSFEDLMEYVPEMERMKGFDQKTPHHLLLLDEHSGQAWTNGVENQWLRVREYRPYVLLALGMHDVGKTVCFQEEETELGIVRHFRGHEAYSQQIIGDVLQRDFLLKDEQVTFVKQLAGLSTNGLLRIYDAHLRHELSQDEYGEQVRAAHEKILQQALALSWNISPQEKIQLAFLFNIADKKAAYDPEKEYTTPHEVALIAHRERQIDFLKRNCQYLMQNYKR